MSAGQAYRRDIDGLRALAILPVVLFHTHVPGFSGGFVGVDIFFVISGFLITGIIAREIDCAAFSLIHFYERRARRILPALLVMMAAVLAASAWLYLPDDFAAVPRSALLTLAFLANVWFFANTGYFAGGAETMPLLHCWSLAVEEQFYVGFPLLLWLIARLAPRRRVPIVAAIAAVSFALAVWKQADTDGMAFYLLPMRAWELFAGALLALGAMPAIRRQWLREGLAALGLGLIAFAVFAYDRHTVFPGVSALAPVLGSALLIHAAPGTLAGRLLSLRLPVAIGLISYSLYLWHWPLIVFTEYARDAPLSGMWQVGVIALAFILAWASWRFVERPFRSPLRFPRRRIFAWSGAGITVIGAAALAMAGMGGWDTRFAPAVLQLAKAREDFSPRRSACLSQEIGGARPACTFGAPGAAPSALLWGDSHGVELAWALGEDLGRSGSAIMQRTRASCPPVLGYQRAADPGCAAFNADVIRTIETSGSIRTVYLAAFWAGENYGTADMARRIDATVMRLQRSGKQVVLVGPVPPQPWNVPRHLAHMAAFGAAVPDTGARLSDYRRDAGWFTANYPRWQAQGVTILDPARALVTGEATRVALDGTPLYFDSHHLSLAGARAVLAANPRR
ncbi:MAG: acyltransferase family protein [Novosphingobium sp.]